MNALAVALLVAAVLASPAHAAGARVERVELVADDARTGDRGQGWGGHQPRYVVHADGTERLVYIRGALSGEQRNWRLMKRAPGGSRWVLEAEGDTDSDAFLIRDPRSDSAHVIAFPHGEATVFSAPKFVAAPIRPGEWPKQGGAYQGAGISADGTLVVKNQFDPYRDGIGTRETETLYASGRWNGRAWDFEPVVKKYIGERYAYDYLLPGAFDTKEVVGVSLRDVNKQVAGLPNLGAAYVWDGVRAYRSGLDSAKGWATLDLMPRRTGPSAVATKAAWMGIQDVFADSRGRLFTLHRASEPGEPTRLYLTVTDKSGRTLYQGTPSYQGGNPRIVEDARRRLWLLSFQSTPNAGTPNVRLFRIEPDFELGESFDLGRGFAGFPYEGFSHLAVPRGGNARSNVIAGSYPFGSKVVAFRIRLPG